MLCRLLDGNAQRSTQATGATAGADLAHHGRPRAHRRVAQFSILVHARVVKGRGPAGARLLGVVNFPVPLLGLRAELDVSTVRVPLVTTVLRLDPHRTILVKCLVEFVPEIHSQLAILVKVDDTISIFAIGHTDDRISAKGRVEGLEDLMVGHRALHDAKGREAEFSVCEGFRHVCSIPFLSNLEKNNFKIKRINRLLCFVKSFRVDQPVSLLTTHPIVLSPASSHLSSLLLGMPQ